MRAETRHKLGGRRYVRQIHTERVDCANARKGRPHYLTLVIGQDGKLMSIQATCPKDAANDTIRRLGGALCYTHLMRLRGTLRRKVSKTSTEVYYKGLDGLRDPFDRVLIASGGTSSPHRWVVPQPREKPLITATARERQRALYLQLLNKHVRRIAKFPAQVRTEIDDFQQWALVAWGYTLATRGADKRWRYDEPSLEHFEVRGDVCPVCSNPGYRLSGRGAASHLRGVSHKENVILRVRQLVRFLNNLGRRT